MKTGITVVALLAVAAVAAGAVRSYAIDPIKSDWSGKAHPTLGVSEIVTINFDLPVKAALFCGAAGAGGAYNVDIYAYPGGVNAWAYAHGVGGPEDYEWLACTLLVQYPDSFVKGRQVEVRWTRAGQAAGCRAFLSARQDGRCA